MPARRKKQLKWSKRSAQDLLDIEDYIARDSQVATDRVIAHLRERATLLESDPSLGRLRFTSSHRELVLTRFPFTIVYGVRGNSIFISRVLHQRRQFP